MKKLSLSLLIVSLSTIFFFSPVSAQEGSVAAIDCEGLFEKGVIEDLSECKNTNMSTGLYTIYEAAFVVAIPIAGIIFGLWLYKKRKKQDKNPTIGAIIFGVSLTMILVLFGFAWST